MIRAKDCVKVYIRGQESIEGFADKVGVTRATIYNLLKGRNVSSELIAKIVKLSGIEFGKGFEVHFEGDGV